MCGIFGFNWKDKNLLHRGLKAIAHRGPDARGDFFDKNISLGFNRLAIIDLSSAGNQPMTNESGDLQIIYNGEIYNHKELRKELKGKHKFKSDTDTEIILHLYEECGHEVVKKLQGMFSFCIYDSKKNILFLARDRLGIKPLYYHQDKGKFIFASEIKAILANNLIKREVNLDALTSYLTFRANTASETFFKNIFKLPPGHIMVYDLKSNTLVVNRYWDISFSPEKRSPAYYKHQVRTLLDDAVRCRLMSDVPFGAYLSGGVDSATIVALMKRHVSQPIKTFSVGFEEDKHSEVQDAKATSRLLGTDHHELLISEDSIKALPEIIYHADEPLADPTAIPIYLLSKYAKKYCTVILTGEGADELFAGYPQYKFMKIQSNLGNLPRMLRKAIARVISLTPKRILDAYFPFASSLGKKGLERFTSYLMSNKPEEQYLQQVSIFNQEEQSSLMKNKVNLYNNYSSHFFNSHKNNIVGKCQELDLKNPMVEDLLMKIDKNTMAFSIEGRVPFLDYRLVELAAKIPDAYKIKGFTRDKVILRDAVKDLLPAEIANRKKKHFFVPIDKWLNNHLKRLHSELLSEEYIKKQGIFNFGYIQNLEKQKKDSPLFYARQIWSLITFQIWYEIFIENKKVTI